MFRKNRVLIVEDEESLLKLETILLTVKGFEVIGASTGKMAIDKIGVEAFDLVLLDIMLPDIDGWLLLSHLHENPATGAIPVIVCSVVREEELARALGARLFVQKPVQRQQFLSALHTVLNPAEAL